MSEEIMPLSEEELVKDMDDWFKRSGILNNPQLLISRLFKTIGALREELRNVRLGFVASKAGAVTRAEKAEAEVKGLQLLNMGWQGYHDKTEAENARLREALPDPDKLFHLADWLDLKEAHDPNAGIAVQLDLRRWARNALNPATTPEQADAAVDFGGDRGKEKD